MKESLSFYAKKFANLRVDRLKGIAPYKPMQDYDEEDLYLPIQESYFLRIEAVQWHQENIFIK